MCSGGPMTVRAMEALPLRACASVMLHGRFLAPSGVAISTVAWNEKTLSPAVTSPFVPSSKKACEAAPPIAVNVHVTTSPVLGGTVPGVTLTVSSVPPPCGTALGFPAPTPLGFVVAPHTLKAVAVLRGFGAPAVKSALLLSVSKHPPPPRKSAVVLLGAGV